MSLAVNEIEAEMLLFVVSKPFCSCSLLVLKSFLTKKSYFVFLISFLTYQGSLLLVQHSDPKVMLPVKLKICFNILISVDSALSACLVRLVRADVLCILCR